jgi:glutathione peroxidase-family protein
MILGFPSNQFGAAPFLPSWLLAAQEPGTNDDIQQFCQLNYGVTFPVLAKIDVNGDKTDPVYQYLKKIKPGLLGLSRIKYARL